MADDAQSSTIVIFGATGDLTRRKAEDARPVNWSASWPGLHMQNAKRHATVNRLNSCIP